MDNQALYAFLWRHGGPSKRRGLTRDQRADLLAAVSGIPIAEIGRRAVQEVIDDGEASRSA